MSSSYSETEPVNKGRWPALPGSLGYHFLSRIDRLVDLRERNPDNRRLIDRSIYVTLMDCRAIGFGKSAGTILQRIKAQSQRQK